MDGDLGRLPNARWDASLGGFNQDLPAPRLTCEVRDGPAGLCVVISGVYGEQSFDQHPPANPAYVHLDGGSRQVGITVELGTDDVLFVATKIGMQVAPIAPSTFEVPSAGVDPADSFVLVEREARRFESHVDGQPVATHDVESRLAGELWFAQRADDAPRQEQVHAHFALSVTPKAGCTPDADGFGCDTIRLRGMMTGGTLRAMPP
jgi:hypothetical protein